ncbi:MAG: DUF4397 domain-containing protein [Ferruginibacter sp.]|nr:DUF4397 domain-containing protein [Ferruginibacter sp.]
MKKTIIILVTFCVFSSCGKVNVYNNDIWSPAVFINASPSVSGSLPQAGLHVFIDTFQKSLSTIAYRGGSGYISSSPGSRKVQVRSSIDLKTNFIDLGAETFTSNKATTYFIYDTLSAANQKLKTIRLDDNLTIPDAGFANFRFLNAAVNSLPLDITFLRTSVTPNDSITVTNQPYIGSSPNAANFSPFSRKLPLGSYTIKLKTAGTQTVLVTPATIVLPLYSSIYTFFAAGTAVGMPLSVGSIRHYP